MGQRSNFLGSHSPALPWGQLLYPSLKCSWDVSVSGHRLADTLGFTEQCTSRSPALVTQFCPRLTVASCELPPPPLEAEVPSCCPSLQASSPAGPADPRPCTAAHHPRGLDDGRKGWQTWSVGATTAHSHIWVNVNNLPRQCFSLSPEKTLECFLV